MQNGIIDIKEANTSTTLLEEIFNTLSSCEVSQEELRETLYPILLNKNTSCGETLDTRTEQSPLNSQLYNVLERVKDLNVSLINLRSEVTL